MCRQTVTTQNKTDYNKVIIIPSNTLAFFLFLALLRKLSGPGTHKTAECQIKTNIKMNSNMYYVYIYISHTHTHTHSPSPHIHTHTYACMQAHTHSQSHMHAPMHTHSHKHAHLTHTLK